MINLGASQHFMILIAVISFIWYNIFNKWLTSCTLPKTTPLLVPRLSCFSGSSTSKSSLCVSPGTSGNLLNTSPSIPSARCPLLRLLKAASSNLPPFSVSLLARLENSTETMPSRLPKSINGLNSRTLNSAPITHAPSTECSALPRSPRNNTKLERRTISRPSELLMLNSKRLPTLLVARSPLPISPSSVESGSS